MKPQEYSPSVFNFAKKTQTLKKTQITQGLRKHVPTKVFKIHYVLYFRSYRGEALEISIECDWYMVM